jgi:hypothetical protein
MARNPPSPATRETSELSAELPGTITAPPMLPFIAIDFTSRRSPACGWVPE